MPPLSESAATRMKNITLLAESAATVRNVNLSAESSATLVKNVAPFAESAATEIYNNMKPATQLKSPTLQIIRVVVMKLIAG